MTSLLDALFDGRQPFAWQRGLYERLVRTDPPLSIEMDTASGKTYGVLRCWLAALVANPHAVPRRLVYVVNRRVVTDQVYEEKTNLIPFRLKL